MTHSNIRSSYQRVCSVLACFLVSSPYYYIMHSQVRQFWFGLGGLGLTDDELLTVGKKAAVCLAVSAFLLVPVVLTILVPPKVVHWSLWFANNRRRSSLQFQVFTYTVPYTMLLVCMHGAKIKMTGPKHITESYDYLAFRLDSVPVGLTYLCLQQRREK
jgi:hypothetical protein